jgi:hypothetical protein
MSEKDINRWQDTITPRDLSKPWVMGPGGSFDMQDVQPIPDAMLAELAQLYNSHGCPWNCRSLPLSPSDREYMYLLYYSMQGLVARMRLAEKRANAHDELAAALRPFAHWASGFGAYGRDDSWVIAKTPTGKTLTMGDVRRAHAAIEGLAKATGGAS